MSAFTDRATCPACKGEWLYEVDGKTSSRLRRVYSLLYDRTVAWRCPHCEQEWPRDQVQEPLAGEEAR